MFVVSGRRKVSTIAATVAVIVSIAGSSVAWGAGKGYVNPKDAKKSSLHIGGGALAFDVFAPFSGPDASFGAHALPSAEAGAWEINNAGGILGHKFTIVQTDSRGDPADAVPAIEQTIATTHNLEAVLGPTSDEALATIPILQRSGVPTFNQAGTVQLDRLRSKWVFRILAPDSSAGVAMAYQAAVHHKWKKGALLFDSDAGAQSLTGPVTRAFAKMGGKITINISLTPDQPSYRTEILKVLAAKPQVIFTETDSQTAATLWSEMQQLHGLTIPTVGSGPTTGADYFQAVSSATNSKTALGDFLQSVTFSTKYTKATPHFLHDLHQWKPGQDPLLNHVNYWDTINVIALAMLHAHSINPDKWMHAVRWVTNDRKATPVYNFTQGKKLMSKGKRIQYVGTKGSMYFNKFGTVSGNFEADKFDASGNLVTINQLPASKLSKY